MSQKKVETDASSRDLSLQEVEKTPAAAAYIEDLQGERNLIGLFDLLLRIDRRTNPQHYAAKKAV